MGRSGRDGGGVVILEIAPVAEEPEPKVPADRLKSLATTPKARDGAHRQAHERLALPRTPSYNTHMVTVNAHFDGKVIVPDEPTGLTPGARLRVTLEPIDGRATQTTHAAARHFQPLNIRIAPELSNAISTDPEFDVQES